MRNDSLEQRAASTCIRDSTRLNYELSLGYELDRTTVCLCLESPEKTRLHRSKYRMKMKNFLHHRSNMVNPVPGRCCCFVPSLSLWPMETAAWNCRQHVISMSPSRSLLLWPLACCWMRAHDPHRHTIFGSWIIIIIVVQPHVLCCRTKAMIILHECWCALVPWIYLVVWIHFWS